MSKYFAISVGLRGCYMPDSLHIVRVDTRRELKRYIESEADSVRDAGYIGANKKAVSWLAAILWKRANTPKDRGLDSVVPYKAKGQDGYPYGIFGSPSTRRDYLDYIKEQE